MKKTKLLMPILGVGAVAATVAPMVAMTSCDKEEAAWKVVKLESSDNQHFAFGLEYTKFVKGNTYVLELIDHKAPIESVMFDETEMGKNTCTGKITLSEPLKEGESAKATFTFKCTEPKSKKEEQVTITLNCVYQGK